MLYNCINALGYKTSYWGGFIMMMEMVTREPLSAKTEPKSIKPAKALHPMPQRPDSATNTKTPVSTSSMPSPAKKSNHTKNPTTSTDKKKAKNTDHSCCSCFQPAKDTTDSRTPKPVFTQNENIQKNRASDKTIATQNDPAAIQMNPNNMQPNPIHTSNMTNGHTGGVTYNINIGQHPTVPKEQD